MYLGCQHFCLTNIYEINDTLSNNFLQTSGVRSTRFLYQVTICFFIYKNELFMDINYYILKLFADDAKIYFSYPRGNWSNLLQID